MWFLQCMLFIIYLIHNITVPLVISGLWYNMNVISSGVTDLCSLNMEFSRTIFSRSSMSSLGRSAVMNVFTVTDTSSGSCVSGRAVWTTCAHNPPHEHLSDHTLHDICSCAARAWSISGRLYGFVSCRTWAQRSGSFRRTRYRDSLLNREFSLHTYRTENTDLCFLSSKSAY